MGYIVHRELDNWEDGCSGDGDSVHVDITEVFKTKEDAFRFIQDCTGETCMDYNACEENGRIDVQVQEDQDGMRLTPAQWEEFKAGRIDTYLATYSFYFKQLQTIKF